MKKTAQTMLTAAAFAAALGLASPDPSAAQITALAEDAGLTSITGTTTQTVYGPPPGWTETTITTPEPQPAYGPPPSYWKDGDLTRDNHLDARDLSLMLRETKISENDAAYDWFNREIADMNDDHNVDEKDVKQLQNFLTRRSQVEEGDYGIVDINVETPDGNGIDSVLRVEIKGSAYQVGYMESHDTLDGAALLSEQIVRAENYYFMSAENETMLRMFVPADQLTGSLELEIEYDSDQGVKTAKQTVQYTLVNHDKNGQPIDIPTANISFDGKKLKQTDDLMPIIITSTSDTVTTTTTTTTRKTRPTQTTETTLLTTVSVPTALYSAPLTSDITSISTTTGTTRKTRPVSTTTTENTVLTTTELPQPVYGPPPSEWS